MPLAIVIMGVAGSGKSTVGRLVAERLGLPFVEADELHPASNVEKMRGGIALADADRRPWAAAVAGAVNSHSGAPGVIVACSALTPSVRAWLADGVEGEVRFIHLAGEPAVIAKRLASRTGHYFDPALLHSQFDALAAPERATTIDIDRPVSEVAAEVESLVRDLISGSP